MDDKSLGRNEPNIKENAKNRKMERSVEGTHVLCFKIQKIHHEEGEIKESAEKRDGHAEESRIRACQNSLATVNGARRYRVGKMLNSEVCRIGKTGHSQDKKDRNEPLMVWSNWRLFE